MKGLLNITELDLYKNTIISDNSVKNIKNQFKSLNLNDEIQNNIGKKTRNKAESKTKFVKYNYDKNPKGKALDSLLELDVSLAFEKWIQIVKKPYKKEDNELYQKRLSIFTKNFNISGDC